MKNLKNKKGFTLVEVIVVLVILAILAAILIPSLTGYIAEANKRKVVAEARSVLVAAQTTVSLWYGTNPDGLEDILTDPDGTEIALNGATVTSFAADIQQFAEMEFEEVSAEDDAAAPIAKIVVADVNGAWTVTEVMYYDGSYSAYIFTGNNGDDEVEVKFISYTPATEGSPASGLPQDDIWYIQSGNLVGAADSAITTWEN